MSYDDGMVLGGQDATGDVDLYRSENLVVRQVAGENRDRWIVTFDHYGIGHGFDRLGFGEAWLRSQGISAIHVLGRSDDWYQYADIEEALATVRFATTGASRVITYGSSMGAYAALRFADAVGATDVLALSPQYSVSPEVAPHEDRWPQDADRIKWLARLNGPILSKARTIIVYDPAGPDRWHGERIEADVPVQSILLPYTSHPVTTYIYEGGLLSPMLKDLLDGTFDPRTFRQMARRHRARSGIYLGELAAAQPLRRQAAALALAQRAIDISPAGAHARVSLAGILSRDGRHDEAVEILTTVVEENARGFPYLVHLGHALLATGRVKDARAVVEEILDQATNFAHLYAWAAHIGWLDGDVSFARRHIRRAVRLAPSNAHYLRLAVDFHFGAPLVSEPRGVKVTPWLRAARWVMRRRSLIQPWLEMASLDSAVSRPKP